MAPLLPIERVCQTTWAPSQRRWTWFSSCGRADLRHRGGARDPSAPCCRTGAQAARAADANDGARGTRRRAPLAVTMISPPGTSSAAGVRCGVGELVSEVEHAHHQREEHDPADGDEAEDEDHARDPVNDRRRTATDTAWRVRLDMSEVGVAIMRGGRRHGGLVVAMATGGRARRGTSSPGSGGAGHRRGLFLRQVHVVDLLGMSLGLADHGADITRPQHRAARALDHLLHHPSSQSVHGSYELLIGR